MAKLVSDGLKVSRTETKATHPVGKGTPELHWNKSAIVLESGISSTTEPTVPREKPMPAGKRMPRG